MKSSMILVLFTVYLFGLIISCTCETDDMTPPSVLNLHGRLHDHNFGKFFTEQQLKNKEYLELTYKKFVETALSAKQLILEKKFEEGRDYLIKSIRDNTVDKQTIHTQQVVREFFGGNPDVVINIIKRLVEMFVVDVINVES